MKKEKKMESVRDEEVRRERKVKEGKKEVLESNIERRQGKK